MNTGLLEVHWTLNGESLDIKMPVTLEHALEKRARHLRLHGKSFNAYVYGTLHRIETLEKKHHKK
jgi:hypothetical protein